MKATKASMIRTYRVIRNNWHRNHRHHGGILAVARCLLGTAAIRRGLAGRVYERSEPARSEVLTFSVVPWLTALWGRLLTRALAGRDVHALIGDCSGGFGQCHRVLMADHRVRVFPCLNDHHGDKIDLFLAKICRAPYVVIADDDVFWLSAEPLTWALAQLDADARVAAVSLLPRRDVSSVLRKDNIAQPMGSHCLVIRRELWQRERLSFAVAPPPAGVEDWFYDTGDLANREILQRGLRVVIAPPEIQRHLVAFDGVSSWVLKLQGCTPGELAAAVADIPVRKKKALQAIYFARELAVLLAELGQNTPAPEIVSAARLVAAEPLLESRVPQEKQAAVLRVVEEGMKRIREAACAPGSGQAMSNADDLIDSPKGSGTPGPSAGAGCPGEGE